MKKNLQWKPTQHYFRWNIIYKYKYHLNYFFLKRLTMQFFFLSLLQMGWYFYWIIGKFDSFSCCDVRHYGYWYKWGRYRTSINVCCTGNDMLQVKTISILMWRIFFFKKGLLTDVYWYCPITFALFVTNSGYCNEKQ